MLQAAVRLIFSFDSISIIFRYLNAVPLGKLKITRFLLLLLSLYSAQGGGVYKGKVK